MAINRALREHNIEIPFPQRDLHIRSVDPSIGLQHITSRGERSRDNPGEGSQ
jgi:small-conductance mechanosensitive channel